MITNLCIHSHQPSTIIPSFPPYQVLQQIFVQICTYFTTHVPTPIISHLFSTITPLKYLPPPPSYYTLIFHHHPTHFFTITLAIYFPNLFRIIIFLIHIRLHRRTRTDQVLITIHIIHPAY